MNNSSFPFPTFIRPISCDSFSQSMYCTISLQNNLVGIIVPTEEAVCLWAGSRGIRHFTFAQLCAGTTNPTNPTSKGALASPSEVELAQVHTQLKAAILEDLVTVGKQAGLPRFEQVCTRARYPFNASLQDVNRISVQVNIAKCFIYKYKYCKMIYIFISINIAKWSIYKYKY